MFIPCYEISMFPCKKYRVTADVTIQNTELGIVLAITSKAFICLIRKSKRYEKDKIFTLVWRRRATEACSVQCDRAARWD